MIVQAQRSQPPQLSQAQVDAVLAEYEELTNVMRSRCLSLRARCAEAEGERDAARAQIVQLGEQLAKLSTPAQAE